MNTAYKPAQQGSVLPVALIMLVLLTLVAVTAITMGSNSVQVVGNAQFRQEASAAAQQAIESLISNTDFTLTPPASQEDDINDDGTMDYIVTFDPPPSCQFVKAVAAGETGVPKECFGSAGTNYCYWTTWDISAVVDDQNTGAKATVHQGVRLVAGLNSALASCGI